MTSHMWLLTSRDHSAIRTSLRRVVGAALLTALISLALPSTAANAAGDDYPYRTQASSTATDQWGFTERQCVSFAAWRLAQAKKPLSNRTQKWGSALTWDDTAKRLGKAISRTPRIGAIAQWNAGEKSTYYASNGSLGTITAGPYGHVAYVRAIYGDNSVVIEQYNLSGTRSYSVMRVKAPRYLYI